MPGRGANPKPAAERRTRHKPVRGEYASAPGVGWQHGQIPDPPDGLLAASRDAWQTWMRAWFAAHWTPDDLPILRQVVRLFDTIERNDASAAELTQYRQLLDSYGITPKGQQDRRWTRPKADDPRPGIEPKADSPYRGLALVVGE